MGINNFDRRAFLVGTAAAITQAGAQTSSQAGHDTAASPVRRSYELNRGWRFLPKAVDNALEPAFDDSRADRITLPHANVRVPWHSFDDRAYEIVSVYRRHFRAPAAWHGYRVFADFDGAMTASTVAINGHAFPEYRGGYTPFSVELTDHLHLDADNVLAVKLDSTERGDIPPFGGRIDYLTFGGIYRDVRLRVVPKTFLANVFARPVRVMQPERGLEVRCWLDGPVAAGTKLAVELRDGSRVVATGEAPVENSGGAYHQVAIDRAGDIQLWDLEHPKLYQVRVKLSNRTVDDEYTTASGSARQNSRHPDSAERRST